MEKESSVRLIAGVGKTVLLAALVLLTLEAPEAHADRIEKSAAGGYIVRADDGTQKGRLVPDAIGDYAIRDNDGVTVGRIDSDLVDNIYDADTTDNVQVYGSEIDLDLVPP